MKSQFPRAKFLTTVLAIAFSFAINTALFALPTSSTSRPTNSSQPPATSPDGKPVRSYTSNKNLASQNSRILNAAKQGEIWVSEPLHVILNLFSPTFGSRYSLYLRPNSVESPSSYQLTVVTSGYLDDSVGGIWTQYDMQVCMPSRCSDATTVSRPLLRLTEIRTANYCRRPNQEFYSASPCP